MTQFFIACFWFAQGIAGPMTTEGEVWVAWARPRRVALGVELTNRGTEPIALDPNAHIDVRLFNRKGKELPLKTLKPEAEAKHKADEVTAGRVALVAVAPVLFVVAVVGEVVTSGDGTLVGAVFDADHNGMVGGTRDDAFHRVMAQALTPTVIQPGETAQGMVYIRAKRGPVAQIELTVHAGDNEHRFTIDVERIRGRSVRESDQPANEVRSALDQYSSGRSPRESEQKIMLPAPVTKDSEPRL